MKAGKEVIGDWRFQAAASASCHRATREVAAAAAAVRITLVCIFWNLQFAKESPVQVCKISTLVTLSAVFFAQRGCRAAGLDLQRSTAPHHRVMD
jgi:hypothetical protein